MRSYCLNALSQNWRTIFQSDSPEAQNLFLELISLCTAPQRFYHNLTHLQQVLETLEMLCSLEEENGSKPDYKTLNLAAWFHDAIYDPCRADNEQRSADYAAEKLAQLAISAAEIDRVRTSILSTQTHQARDRDSQILLDADLAILGAPPDDYWDYARAIRNEYAGVRDRDYAAGRTQVLSKFLARSRIYYTPYLFAELERQARMNLEAEMARLNSIGL